MLLLAGLALQGGDWDWLNLSNRNRLRRAIGATHLQSHYSVPLAPPCRNAAFKDRLRTARQSGVYVI
ncbi:TPA: hypothetical protein ACJIYU_004147 [Yersinia enterocolitica]|uniref:hypothetical protein n=1 Tax=Yersinia enterocolitica TaxID=630 RepID=UPI000ABF758C|nr:hypothetical protein [Yersinia enterocolitica]ELI8280741.1 hypothetical protein [Yersinia enterocolitica]HDL6709113.1 hypothetical protein [Yersinia enterocolitica]HDL7933169.1 hypothetical protein [Yersinia enterocolitica]HEN3238035.1 hypothetical protein [Yersinia enterocolitica]